MKRLIILALVLLALVAFVVYAVFFGFTTAVIVFGLIVFYGLSIAEVIIEFRKRKKKK